MKRLHCNSIGWISVFGTVLLVQCTGRTATENLEKKHTYHLDSVYALVLPYGFSTPEIPADNRLTKRRVRLGRYLFFDPVLSADSTVSCGSCHLAERGMADTVRFSTGVNGAKGKRNAPALVNMAWQPSFMRDGGVPTLEMQVLSPISDPLEMAFNIAEASERLMHDSFYVREARLAYGRNPDPYVITRALAAYQRTIISGASDYDRYQKNRPSHVLSTSAEKGYRLFFSHKTDCSKCHSGFNFTDYSIRGNGLYRNYRDTGRARITFRKADVGKFRVPGLRNVAVTAPYMHDGSLQTLEEVVEHYNRGGQNHVNQDSLIRPLGLNAREKTDLVAFLQTLTDTAFLQKSMNYE